MEEQIRVLKTASCVTVSGRSKIEYTIGCDHSKTIYLRIAGNTGRGIFSRAWIPITQFVPFLTKEEVVTAKMMRSAFDGMSVNTLGFIIAALIREGFLKGSDTEKHKYLPLKPSEFHTRLHAFTDNGLSMPGKGTKGTGVAVTQSEDETSGNIHG